MYRPWVGSLFVDAPEERQLTPNTKATVASAPPSTGQLFRRVDVSLKQFPHYICSL